MGIAAYAIVPRVRRVALDNLRKAYGDTLTDREIARGLVAYDAADARRIIGLKSADIEKTLGFRGRDELIHRDDLVLMGKDHT